MKKTQFILISAFLLSLTFVQGSSRAGHQEPIIDSAEIAILAFRSDSTTPMPFNKEQLQAASSKAIKLIQNSQAVWYKRQVCSSCHHQLLPEGTLKLARERGISFDETVAREMTTNTFAYLRDLDAALQGYDYIDVLFDGGALAAASTVGIAPNLSTTVIAQFIASRQQSDGSWPTGDARPPQAHSTFATTAVCAQAIQRYLPDRFKNEKDTRIRQARTWLTKSQPRTTEDRAYQLLGMHWTGALKHQRMNAARLLLAEQRPDGGWSQLPDMPSDAYATGETLVALHLGAGLPATDAAYQRGVRFLVDSQQLDGSWHVKTRLHPPAPLSPPYFESGFPYKRDQFISIMGTCWAVNALLYALPPQPIETSRQPLPAQVAPVGHPEWVRVALTGTVTELKQLLDSGVKPDAKTSEGTTMLMLAARDIQKVRLLVARGADVNARANSGITPLMIASRFRGNAEVIRLLLKNGAKPNAGPATEVRNEASAPFYAVTAGDVATVSTLVNAGAPANPRMKILGIFPFSSLATASVVGDLPMVEYLISKGANPNDVDNDQMTALHWATLTNHAKVVDHLLLHGAKVNHTDTHGMTPLLYAASVNFGDTSVLERLLAARADLNAKNKEGLTALDLAKKYNHTKAAILLAGRVASR
jgi:N-acyl-D-amino-acid deacylase